jgi:hypothetical protein
MYAIQGVLLHINVVNVVIPHMLMVGGLDGLPVVRLAPKLEHVVTLIQVVVVLIVVVLILKLVREVHVVQ